MRYWTKEEVEKLCEMCREGRTSKEMAKTLGRTKDSINTKVNRLKGKRSDDLATSTIYRKNISSSTELEKKETPSREEIYDKLVLALLAEFDRLKNLLNDRGPQYAKQKPKLYTNLFRCTDVLLRILKSEPEKNDIDEWAEIIAEKLPPEIAEPRKLLKQWIPKRRKI